MKSTIFHNFHFISQVYQKRLQASTVRGILLQFFLVFLLKLTLTFSPLAPLQWLSASFLSILSPSAWFYDLLIVASYLVFGLVVTSNHVSVRPFVPTFRISVLMTCLANARVVASLAAHAAIGGILARCYLGILGGPHNSLTTPCSRGR